MHIVLPNVQLSPGCTSCIPDPADGKAALSVVQFEEERSPSPHDHKAGHTVAWHNATPEPVKSSHGTNLSLYSHCSNCQKTTTIQQHTCISKGLNQILSTKDFLNNTKLPLSSTIIT